MNTLTILITRYFRLQKYKGRGRIAAVLLFIPIAVTYLPKILKYLVVFSFMSGKKNVKAGFGLYDKPLLASYPRSGTNWIRYIIESLSGKPTPGQTRLHTGADYVIDRAHKAYPVMHRHQKVILVLRDYRECLLRNSFGLWAELNDSRQFLEEKVVLEPPHWYIDNLQAYDNFSGSKLLVYYEDLLSQPESAIPKIAQFLNFDPVTTEAFLSNLDHHKQQSLSLFKSGGHSSETEGDTMKASYHADMHISTEQKSAFDFFYMEKYPELFKTYLARYES